MTFLLTHGGVGVARADFKAMYLVHSFESVY